MHDTPSSSSPSIHKSRWNTTKPIELDGRTLEGGGQLVRNALCLSALTGIPIKLHHIRANRGAGGGLNPQNLACVQWLAHACNARVQGAERRSPTLLFEPGRAPGDNDGHRRSEGHSPTFEKTTKNGRPIYDCRIDIGTAGSTALALQAILPFILFSERSSAIPVRLTLTGGTNVSASPRYEYVTQVLLPALETIGFPSMHAQLGRRGWSQGGESSIGNFTIEIPPRERVILPAFRLVPQGDENDNQSRLGHLQATFLAPQTCHDHFRKCLPSIVREAFTDLADDNLSITCEPSHHDKRMYFILVATLSVPSPTSVGNHLHNTPQASQQTYKLAADWLYDRKIRSHTRVAEEMASRVTADLAAEVASGAAVDTHMRDQLIIFQALAAGKSVVHPGIDEQGFWREASLHTQTAAWVVSEMLGVKIKNGGRCEGVGFAGREDEGGGGCKEEMGLEKKMGDMGLS